MTFNHPKCKGLFNNIYQSQEKEYLRENSNLHEPEGDSFEAPGTENIAISNMAHHFPSNGFDLRMVVFMDKKFIDRHGNEASAKQEAQRVIAHAEQIYLLETANDICDHLTMPKIYFEILAYDGLDFELPDPFFKHFL